MHGDASARRRVVSEISKELFESAVYGRHAFLAHRIKDGATAKGIVATLRTPSDHRRQAVRDNFAGEILRELSYPIDVRFSILRGAVISPPAD